MINKLYNIIDDLNNYKRDKNELLYLYINDRLNKSLQTYYEELTSGFNYLKYKDSKNVLNKLNR